jgi:hypothetical protein
MGMQPPLPEQTDFRLEIQLQKVMLGGMTTPKPKLRWLQFSLRTLLIVVTLCAIPCSWYAVKKQQGREQREIAKEVEMWGGRVEWSRPSSPQWLRGLLGEELFNSVKSVNFAPTPVYDDGVDQITGVSHLQGLYLDGTKITDSQLEHLERLGQLQTLWLDRTQVTDEGVKKLQQALPNCEIYR